ncbi:methyltransferase [Nocardiopsis sediminis]|uniref:Methyltransferase n=1 Tax=Nocardiopsis sediminis TaxID=1778267 RepID=A0ABV8FGJ8_9ACTN
MEPAEEERTMSAVEQVSRMATLFTPWALRAAVTLRLPDLVAKGVVLPEELARRSGANGDGVVRLLRHLANLGVLTAEESGGYGLTDLGRVLCSDHPSGIARALDQSDAWARAGDRVLLGLPYSVRTGRPAWEEIFGHGLWDALAADEELGAAFDRAMAVHAANVGPWLADAWEWSSVGHVVDVGGGTGGVVATLLQRHGHLRGTVVDLPATAERASALLVPAGVSDRAETVGQSFFDPLPAGADVYLLAHVLHDWPAEDASRILRGCAEALSRRGRVLVVDRLVSAGGRAPLSVTQRDMAMLVVLGGRERTAEEFRRLGGQAGLRLVAAHPSPEEGLYLIEYAPVR